MTKVGGGLKKNAFRLALNNCSHSRVRSCSVSVAPEMGGSPKTHTKCVRMKSPPLTISVGTLVVLIRRPSVAGARSSFESSFASGSW
jgi:hypothetical protein